MPVTSLRASEQFLAPVRLAELIESHSRLPDDQRLEALRDRCEAWMELSSTYSMVAQ